MDRELLPFIVAFSASALVVWRASKDNKNSKGAIAGFAIAVFIVAISITHTILFIPFSVILRMLAFGMLPAGLFAGAAYLSELMEGKGGDPKGCALLAFVGIMFLWLVAIGFVGGRDSDYDENCHDVGTLGIYTVCE